MCTTARRRKRCPFLRRGSFWCDTPALCAAGRDAVITMVGFPKDVEKYISERTAYLPGQIRELIWWI